MEEDLPPPPVSAISELVLEVADLEAARRFYRDGLGLEETLYGEGRECRYWYLIGESARLGLWTPQVGLAGGRGGAHVHFAMAVPDDAIEGLAERLAAAGIEVEGPIQLGPGRAIFATDPDGNVVELWSQSMADYCRTARGGAGPGTLAPAGTATTPSLSDGTVTLRALAEGEVDELAAMLALPGVREWWSPLDDPASVREGLIDDGLPFAIEVAGELAGWLQVVEETDPDSRAAAIDLFLGPGHQGHGHGPAALGLAIGWLAGARGHHRLTIDPAVANERAIAVYERLGFRRVGVMRSYERGADGAWHDNLLMELIVGSY